MLQGTKSLSLAKSRIEELEKVEKGWEEEHHKRKLMWSGLRRLTGVFVLSLVLAGALVYAAITWGQGDNWFQKLKNSWIFVTFGLGVPVVLAWFMVGKERLAALPWALRRLFPSE